MSDTLRLQRVTKRYGGVVAVDGVSLEVAPGEILGIIGPNGAGKSTLLGLACGAIRVSEGDVWLGEHRLTRKRLDQVARAGVSRTYQIPRPFMHMTVRQNVDVAHEYGGTGSRSVEEILEFCGLSELAEAQPAELTHGDHRRIEFARSLATEPRVMLLDELGAGLIQEELDQFAALIRQVADAGVTIVFVEHIVSFVMSLATRVIAVDMGSKIADGSPEEVAVDSAVIDAYLGELT